jgi:ubiquinone/menaquinone biosynthesis C-methylase UbiE
MDWRILCAVNSIKAMVPFHRQLRLLQYKFRRFPENPLHDNVAINQGLDMIEWVKRYQTFEGSSVLDVGSGWSPLIPALFTIAGAGRVYLTDLNRLMTKQSLDKGMRSLRANRETVERRLKIEPARLDAILESVEQAPNLESGLKLLRLDYMAPCDCQKLPFATGELDLVMSRAVLEHVPPPVIQNIFIEAERLLKPGSHTMHIVDNSDHWQHKDPSLSRLYFLRFSPGVFRWTHLNSLDYQNRLRHSQYVAMLKNAKLEVVEEKGIIDSKALADLADIPLAEEFKKFPPEDLAAIESHLVARKHL